MTKYADIWNNLKCVLNFSKRFYSRLVTIWKYFLEKPDSFIFVTCVYWDNACRYSKGAPG